MVKVAAALLVAWALPGLEAAWTVCMDDRAGNLSAPVRAAILWEFHVVMGSQAARVEFGDCQPDPHRVAVAIESEPPEHLPDVLGRARRRTDGIEPNLEVYFGPLVRYLGQPNNASAVGRALARVAAHEATHFLEQQPHHCEAGLLRATFPAYELAARNPRPFRYTRRCRRVRAELADRHPGIEIRAQAGRFGNRASSPEPVTDR